MYKKKFNRFLEYLLFKYEDKFMDEVLGFAQHHIPLLKEKLDIDRLYIQAENIELQELNPQNVYIELVNDDVIAFDIIFNPTYECYCQYGHHHDYETETVNLWLTIPGSGTLSGGLKDIKFGWCSEYSRTKPHKPLEGNLIPVLSHEDYDRVAEEILCKFYSEYEFANKPIDMEKLAERMGANVVKHPISVDGKSFGRVVFDETVCELFNKDKGTTTKYKVSENTIIIDTNTTNLFSLGSENITLAHELVHFYLHKNAFRFAKIIDKDLSQLECRSISSVCEEDDPMRWFEIQANGIAPCLAMPKKLLLAKYKELECVYAADKGNYIDAIEDIITELADYFNVTRYSVKKRLLDLGVESVQGVYNYADGHYVRPYLFKEGALDHDETYTISFADFTSLLDNGNCLAYFYKGDFVFVENHLCLNSEKYVEKDKSGKDILTHYARTHIDECCVKFKCKSSNEVVTQAKFSTFCYLCRDIAEDIKVIIDLSPNTQTLLKDKTLTAKMKNQNDAENIVKKRIAGSNLSETLNVLKKIFKWTNLSMALDIGMDEKTIERYVRGEIKTPNRGVIIAMCLAMGLTPELTWVVLKNAGFTIETSTYEDKVLRSVIISCRDKSIEEINEFLIGAGVKSLT